MKDEFMRLFGWISDLFGRQTSDFFDEESKEHAIIERLKAGWEKTDPAELLKSLTNEYGDKAGQTVERYLELNILKDWAEIGSKEAHEGSEIEDFIRVLWVPLKDSGFEYDIAREHGKSTFCVKKCPVYELAEKTGLHEWFYHLACSSDYHTPRAFSPRIGFERTKTLMEGHDLCNHQYYYR